MTLLWVALGAAVGAPLRYLTDSAVQSRHDTVFPWGTLTVNIVASLVLGVVTGAVTAGAASAELQALIGTGLCGALSTYSTFSYESLRLAQQGLRFFAFANVAASVVAGLGAALLSTAIAQAAWT